MSITIGIVDALFVEAHAVKTEGSVSASVDLAFGLCLLVRALVVAARAGRRMPTKEARARTGRIGCSASRSSGSHS